MFSGHLSQATVLLPRATSSFSLKLDVDQSRERTKVFRRVDSLAESEAEIKAFFPFMRIISPSTLTNISKSDNLY